jgi:photosystem II stability/assembly factor-like uncharacterized protein
MGFNKTLAAVTVAVGLAAPGAQAAVTAGHSGWQWADPLPQGHAIRAVDLDGPTGYAAGDFGTLLGTDDGGLTWSGLAVGSTADLSHVTAIDQDSVVVAGRCAVRRSDDAGATFARLPWTASDERCPVPIAAVAFPADQQGYLALQDGTVQATADGGRTWSRVGDPPTAGDPAAATADLHFTSAERGVLAAASGLLYRTTDGGSSWSLAYRAPRGLRSVEFLSSLIGLAVGEGGMVLATLDGGASWLERFGDTPATLTSISCATLFACLAVTDSGDRLLRTTDAGSTFTPVPSSEFVFAAAIGSGSYAVAAGRSGESIASRDAGATWSPVGGRLAGSFVRLRATSPTLAFAAGREGAVARTIDGGRTWQSLRLTQAEDVTDVSFASAEVGYALDLVGRVSKTTDGGRTWRSLRTGFGARPQAALATASGVLLVGPRVILRSTDGGATFKKARNRARRAKIYEVDRAGKAIFAYGSRRIAISRDAGRTWSRVRRPRFALLAAVDFVTPRIGYLLEQDGRLWRTRDRGRTWRELPGIGTDDAIGMAYSSPRRGYLVLSRFGDDARGYLLRTTDAGRTWRPQLVTRVPLDADGLAARGATDFALGTDGSLFFTSSGGDAGAPSTVRLSTSRKRLSRPGTIRLSGSVKGAAPGSRVLIARRLRGEAVWDQRLAAVAPDGTFRTTWRIGRTTRYVAQWIGDDDQAGDGSSTHTVHVRR